MLPLNFARLEFKVEGLEFEVCKGQPFLNWLYLTIRLLALDYYEVIVDEGEARINYHLIEIESE